MTTTLTKIKLPPFQHIGGHVEMHDVVVDFDKETGAAYLDGELLGYVHEGEYSYSPKAAGHNRIVRYHSTVAEWQATTAREVEKSADERKYSYCGGNYPSHYRKNTRRAALAYLVVAARGLSATDAAYFTWVRL